MKKLFKITIFILFLTCVDDSAHGPYGSDNTPPGVVEINEVVNTPGGAIYILHLLMMKTYYTSKHRS